jgi:tetratricopeptide (TPR) repeat protein
MTVNLYPQSKFKVAFQRFYVFDSSRKYPLQYESVHKDSALFFRPMLVQVWYPTKDKIKTEFTYGNYFNFKSTDTTWAIFLAQLKSYYISTSKENSFRGRAFKGDTILGNALFDSLLKMDCGIQENAKTLGTKLPLIVYQQSLGGTIEENALLCQSIAANGFVVVNCAYQSDIGGKMYADWNLERAEKDVSFLLKFTPKHFSIDTANIHLLGFSFGAQSNFNLLTKSYPIKSVVSIDSRLEYYFDYNPRGYKNLPQTLLGNKEKINIPLLIFTNPSAAFCIPDSLNYADRYYAMAKGLEHYDFCSQKQISYALLIGLHRDVKLEQKLNTYLELNRKIISFFNFYKKPKNRKRPFKIKESRKFYVENLLVGQTRPIHKQDKFKSPRQAILSIENKGLDYFKQHYPNKRITIDEEILNSYAYYLMKQNNNQLAIDVLKWAVELYPQSANLFDSLGEVFYLQKDFQNALISYEKSLSLDPKNTNARKMIEQLKTK